MLYRPDPVQGQKDRRFYTAMLKSDACQCGRTKQMRRALCYKCWFRLPGDMRRALYQAIGAGFEAAYEAACGHLND